MTEFDAVCKRFSNRMHVAFQEGEPEAGAIWKSGLAMLKQMHAQVEEKDRELTELRERASP